MAILSGRFGNVTIGALVNVPATNISVNSKAETIDTTNFSNNGFDSHVIGMYSAEITCDLLAVASGYGIVIGGTGSILIYDGAATLTIDNCVLTSIAYDAAAKDVQKMSLTFATYGAFSFIPG